MMEEQSKDTNNAISGGKADPMDTKTTEPVDITSDSSAVGNLVIDVGEQETAQDQNTSMEDADGGQKENDTPEQNEHSDTVDANHCVSEPMQPSDEVHDNTSADVVKPDSELGNQKGVGDKSAETGVDGDLLLLTLDGTSDKHAVLINELQNKEKIISDLRMRVGELEAQLGIMSNLRATCTKRPSRFAEHATSLKRARARSSTPSRRVSVHLKSLKRARLRSPLCHTDWNSQDVEQGESMSQSSSILSAEDMDVLAVEVSQRLSSTLVADVTAQVLQQILPLMDMPVDDSENNHMGEDMSAAGMFQSDASTNVVSDAVESSAAENNSSSSSMAVQSGQSTKVSVDFVHAANVSSISAFVTTRHLAAHKRADVCVSYSKQVSTLANHSMNMASASTCLNVQNQNLVQNASKVNSLIGCPLIVGNAAGSVPSHVESLTGSSLIDLNAADSVQQESDKITASAGGDLICQGKASPLSASSDKYESKSLFVKEDGSSILPSSTSIDSEVIDSAKNIEKLISEVLDDDGSDTETGESSVTKPEQTQSVLPVQETSDTSFAPVQDVSQMGKTSQDFEKKESESKSDHEKDSGMLTMDGEKDLDKIDSVEKPPSTVVSTQAKTPGVVSPSAARDGGSSTASGTGTNKIHIPNIFRQRHAYPQSNRQPHMQIRHPVGMSASTRFGMNMHRMPMPAGAVGTANAMLMQQIMNSSAGAALTHINQMNHLAMMQAQQRGIRPQLQNARFSSQVSPMMSPRASNTGVNMGQARNLALSAAFRRAVSSRVVTGQRLNMNNR